MALTPWAHLGPLVASTIAIGSTLGGYFFGYSEKWIAIANSAMTIITFLMVFLIQNTQYRETRSIHLKLDELIKGVEGSRTSLVGLERLSDDELDGLQEEFKHLYHREKNTDEKIAQQ